jgi:hypothetical protein
MLLYFLPAIIALGVITSCQDIAVGKIRNRWIILALTYVIAMYSFLIPYYYSTTGVSSHYLVELFTNILFAVAVAFGLWYSGIWTAGDGKLFVAFAALLPLSVYSFGYYEWIPSLTLLTNVFVSSLVILLAIMLFKVKGADLKKILNLVVLEFVKPKQLIFSAVYLFAISWVISIIFSAIRLGASALPRILATLAIFSLMRGKLQKQAFYVTLTISVLRFALDKSIYTISFLAYFAVLLFVWIILSSFLGGAISNLTNLVFTREVAVSGVREGMTLAETIEKRKRMKKGEIRALRKLPETEVLSHRGSYFVKKPKSLLNFGNFIFEEAEGLTREQIQKIRRAGLRNVRISETIPFAPLIFLGALLTIIAKGNILIVIINLLQSVF